MYQFKNKNMLYTDTDSIDTTELLNPKFIGDDLGQFKLEHVFDEAVYLAPKVYGGIDHNNGVKFTKIKGLKNKLPLSILESLLNKNNSSILSNEKWIKSFELGKISVLDMKYTLTPTNNKRNLIYSLPILPTEAARIGWR